METERKERLNLRNKGGRTRSNYHRKKSLGYTGRNGLGRG